MFSIWSAIASTFIRLIPSFMRGKRTENVSDAKNENSANIKPPKKPKFKKKKFKSLTVDDVNDSLFELNKQLKILESEIEEYPVKIDELMEKGRKEKNQDMKLLRAKQVNSLKVQLKQKTDQMMFLMYNISLLEKLKIAVKNNEFFDSSSSVPINALLGQPKELAKFLNESLGRRVSSEQMMMEAESVFQESESYYEAPDEIYGMRESDSELLAQFEEVNQIEDEQDIFSQKSTENNEKVSTDNNDN